MLCIYIYTCIHVYAAGTERIDEKVLEVRSNLTQAAWPIREAITMIYDYHH